MRVVLIIIALAILVGLWIWLESKNDVLPAQGDGITVAPKEEPQTGEVEEPETERPARAIDPKTGRFIKAN